jgi:hypothetical protein
MKPKVESFGGPDNWAAATAMAALVEGLAGVKNDGLAFDKVTLAPRWSSAGVDSVNVTIRFAASDGYVSYQYKNNSLLKQIDMLLTGSGSLFRNHVLLPDSASAIESVIVNGQKVSYKMSKIEQSLYADFDVSQPGIYRINIHYH